MPALLFILFISTAHGQGACSLNKGSPALQIGRFKCEQELVTNECKEWFEANPETAQFARNCSDPEDQRTDMDKVFSVCLDTFGEVWGELWRNLAKAGDYYDKLEQDLELKQNLADEAYFTCGEFPCRKESVLRDVSVGDLVRKRENLRRMALRDSKYRGYLEAKHVPMPPLGEGIGDVNALLAVRMGLKALTDLGTKALCYNVPGYTRLICYALANITEPLTVAGGVTLYLTRPGRFAAVVLREAPLEKGIAKAEASAVKALPNEILKPLTKGLNAEQQARVFRSIENARAQVGETRVREILKKQLEGCQ